VEHPQQPAGCCDAGCEGDLEFSPVAVDTAEGPGELGGYGGSVSTTVFL